MVNLLARNGIKASVKYLKDGSLKGTWKINGKNEDLTTSYWWNSPELWEKLTTLGFTDFNGKQLNQFSGNGGTFSIFARYHKTQEMFN